MQLSIWRIHGNPSEPDFVHYELEGGASASVQDSYGLTQEEPRVWDHNGIFVYSASESATMKSIKYNSRKNYKTAELQKSLTSLNTPRSSSLQPNMQDTKTVSTLLNILTAYWWRPRHNKLLNAHTEQTAASATIRNSLAINENLSNFIVLVDSLQECVHKAQTRHCLQCKTLTAIRSVDFIWA